MIIGYGQLDWDRSLEQNSLPSSRPPSLIISVVNSIVVVSRSVCTTKASANDA